MLSIVFLVAGSPRPSLDATLYGSCVDTAPAVPITSVLSAKEWEGDDLLRRLDLT